MERCELCGVRLAERGRMRLCCGHQYCLVPCLAVLREMRRHWKRNEDREVVTKNEKEKEIVMNEKEKEMNIDKEKEMKKEKEMDEGKDKEINKETEKVKPLTPAADMVYCVICERFVATQERIAGKGPEGRCEAHGELITHFCLLHSVPICPKCVNSHKNCEMISVLNHTIRTKVEIANSINRMNNLLFACKRARESYKYQSTVETINSIDKIFNKIIKEINLQKNDSDNMNIKIDLLANLHQNFIRALAVTKAVLEALKNYHSSTNSDFASYLFVNQSINCNPPSTPIIHSPRSIFACLNILTGISQYLDNVSSELLQNISASQYFVVISEIQQNLSTIKELLSEIKYPFTSLKELDSNINHHRQSIVILNTKSTFDDEWLNDSSEDSSTQIEKIESPPDFVYPFKPKEVINISQTREKSPDFELPESPDFVKKQKLNDSDLERKRRHYLRKHELRRSLTPNQLNKSDDEKKKRGRPKNH